MRVPLEPDINSVHAARHNDQASELAAIYDRTVDDVYRYCLARSGDEETAADVTADVFVSAARAFAEGLSENVTRPWLFTVAKARLVDHWRRSSRHDRRVQRLRRVGDRNRLTGDLSDEMSSINAADVLEALKSLPDRQCAALTLRYLDELSVAEIADELSVTYAAAESLLARARRSFERSWANLGQTRKDVSR